MGHPINSFKVNFMRYKCQFRVNNFELLRTSNEAGLLDYLKRKHAGEIALKLCEHIPFQLNEEVSTRRELTPAYGYHDISNPPFQQYDVEFFAVSTKDWDYFKRRLSRIITTNEESRNNAAKVMQYISELERK